MKTCSKCRINKSLEDFNKSKGRKDGFENRCKSCRKEDRLLNKDKINKRSKKYREKNKEKIKEKSKKYYYENKEKMKEKSKKYYEENKKVLLEKNRVRSKLHYEENKDYYLANSAKRRAKKLQATPPWLTEEQLKEIQEFYRIRLELLEQTGIEHHVDHIIPLQGETVCGLHVPWNLQVIPAEENLSKSNKVLDTEGSLV